MSYSRIEACSVVVDLQAVAINVRAFDTANAMVCSEVSLEIPYVWPYNESPHIRVRISFRFLAIASPRRVRFQTAIVWWVRVHW